MAKYSAVIYREITIKRGWEHNYLGMVLNYLEKGKLKVTMKDYTKKILDSFTEDIGQAAMMPASDYLFQVRNENEGKKLPQEQAAIFHHSVGKLLLFSGRARREIQRAVAFLTTEVKNPDEDD